LKGLKHDWSKDEPQINTVYLLVGLKANIDEYRWRKLLPPRRLSFCSCRAEWTCPDLAGKQVNAQAPGNTNQRPDERQVYVYAAIV
jgi:hypothetical protein